jgi:hypothetical protein
MRHGISHDRSADVIETCAVALVWSDGPVDGLLFLGLDRHGVPLEVGAIELREGSLLVVHAMPIRRRYLDELREVMRWRDR